MPDESSGGMVSCERKNTPVTDLVDPTTNPPSCKLLPTRQWTPHLARSWLVINPVWTSDGCGCDVQQKFMVGFDWPSNWNEVVDPWAVQLLTRVIKCWIRTGVLFSGQDRRLGDEMLAAVASLNVLWGHEPYHVDWLPRQVAQRLPSTDQLWLKWLMLRGISKDYKRNTKRILTGECW